MCARRSLPPRSAPAAGICGCVARPSVRAAAISDATHSHCHPRHSLPPQLFRSHGLTPAPATLFSTTRNTPRFTAPATVSFLIAGVACVALSYATTIYCPLSLDAGRWVHPQHDTDVPAPAVAALQRARRICRLSDRPGHPQRRPPFRSNLPMACASRRQSFAIADAIHVAYPWAATGFAQREYDAHHDQRTRATLHPRHFLPVSLSRPNICAVDPPSPLDSSARTYLGTAPSI
ncbi:hypothetical protein B0H14DRAFT_2642744 [Mycena olivaceomarginata]|nr:hypothetical protein B0H14DRAFT_2642744 [Mycena olivaceomarginata]